MVKGTDETRELFILTLKQAFGDRFYAEIMFSTRYAWKVQLAFADEYDLPFVFTADAHFLRPDDYKLHAAMNKLLRGYSFPNDSLYLHSYDNMARRAIGNGFPAYRVEDGIARTIEIANRIETFEVSHPVELPAPKRAKDDLMQAIASKRKEMIVDGIWNKEYKDRLSHEVQVITKMKFWDYFWMVKKVVDYGKGQGIALGHGRGSAAGSLVVYMLGITDVDPIKYNLIFERFLNIARKGVVDIDLDWQADRRDEIIEFAHDEWGALPLITISTYSHKSLLNDLAKVFGIPASTKKKLEDENSDEFEQFMLDEPEFAQAYNILINGVRHRGKHASGFAIGKNKTVPIERMKGNSLTYGVPLASSQYDDLTPFGYTKFDLLGLTSLSALARMQEISGVEVK
jgi:DNA polymerase-3 subunit alpha